MLCHLGREPINLPGGRLARLRYIPIADQIPLRSEMTRGANSGLMQCSKSQHFADWRLASAKCSEERRRATGVNFCKVPAANVDKLAGKRRQDADRCLNVPRIMPLLELL
jgi:hypothetical protein